MSEAPVSIVLRSFNEAWALKATLPALKAQDYGNWELIVFDSGSTDGSEALIREAAPRHFVKILPQDYQPGRVLNAGMRLASADVVIFLNADATPLGPGWLRPLVAALQEPGTAAVYSRQVPRPNCRAVFAGDYERCFGASREPAGRSAFFSMASSGIRRDIWERRGFLEAMQYSEDEEYARWCRARGLVIGYCPESVVAHSHNYTPKQAYKRSFGEAWAVTAMGGTASNASTWTRVVALGWLNDARRDLGFCLRKGRLSEWPQGWRVRWAQRRGKLAGLKSGVPPGSDLGEGAAIRSRFTIDGGDDLERRLAATCDTIVAGIRGLIPAHRLEAVLLGGGYGRGEGGVMRTPEGERPYNDLEFYVCLRGNRHLNERRFSQPLHVLGEILTPGAGVDVEFKIVRLAEYRRSSVSMFSYDLLVGHRLLVGDESMLFGLTRHRIAEKIPTAEATRLLMNRCSGLLFAQERLERSEFGAADADFVHRNIAKAELAFGDAVLAAHGRYHWSCRERGRRLLLLHSPESIPWLEEVRHRHAAGVAFKLHPERSTETREALQSSLASVAALGLQVWLWQEQRRLGARFTSAGEYAGSRPDKCPETSALRNALVSIKLEGFRAILGLNSWRHPRERVLNGLCLLLWEPGVQSPASFRNLVLRYRELWQRVN